jgi:plasmid stabilization system protein ParE
MVNKTIYTVVWDSLALNQLKEILQYLQSQSKHASLLVKKAILDKIDHLTLNPFLFEQDKLKFPPDNSFRAFTVFSYRITYQVKVEIREIRILRVRHVSREPLGY